MVAGSQPEPVPELFSIDMSVLDWVIFMVAGILTGIINTLAGSGSLITLPIFVFLCGLPAPVANGTNRIGALLQSGVGLATYVKSGKAEFEQSGWLVVPTVVGAIVGATIAVELNEETMNLVLGVLMVFMLFVLLLKPSKWIHELPIDLKKNRQPLTILSFFLIGVYGGFIQAGVGIFLLMGLVLISRYRLSTGNGVKLLIVLLFSIPSLAIFFLNDQVHVGYGLAMAGFQALGAWMAVKWIIHFPGADRWIHRLLIVIVALAASKFLFW